MRVVFLTHNYPRYAGDLPGNFLHPLARALRERGVDVSVVAPSDGGKGGRERLDGVPIWRVRYASADREVLAYRGTMTSALRTPAGLHALSGMIRAFSGAVRQELAGVGDGLVHAHWWFPAAMAVPRSGRMVVTCHGTDVRILDRNRVARWLGRRVLRRANVVTTVSRYLAGVIEQRVGRRIPDTDVQAMPVADVPRPISRGGGGIVLIGRLTAQKRVDLALRAIARLRERGWEGPVSIVGDGPERARLMVQLGALGLGDLAVFAGTVPQAEVPRWLERADLCLITARHEGLGLVAAEALMQGVPTVACTDGGGLLDVVPLEGGGRIVAPDPDAIAAAAQQLLEDPEAPASARRLGELWQERLSPEGVAERCVGWYQRVLRA